jgi:chromosome segregation ATPase
VTEVGTYARTLEKQVADLARAHDEAVRQRDDANATVGTLQGRIVEAEVRISEQSRVLEERRIEIERRGGWRWWLRLPLVRLGLAKDEPPL